MSALALRPATEDDFAPLTMLWAEGWDAGHAKIAPKELIRLRTAESFHLRLRGFGKDLLVIGVDQFYVRQDQTGTGLAATLMNLVEAELLARGTTQAKLECLADNDRACAFYRKMGWQGRGMEDITVDTSKGPYVLPAMNDIFSRRFLWVIFR